MKIRKRLTAKCEEAMPGVREKVYAARVNELIRAKYSQSDENAILRKRLAGAPGSEEAFDEFNAFAESCKAFAKAELGI